MLFRLVFLTLFFSITLFGCSGTMTYPNSPNFNKQTARFQHPKGDLHDKSFADLFKFFSAYFTRESDERENAGFPVLLSSKSNLATFKENVMWVGHSTLLLNHSGLTIMTDPQFSGRASPFSFMGPKRVTSSPLEIADLPRIDVVVISHNHYDHLDEASIREIARTQSNVEFLVPLGLAVNYVNQHTYDFENKIWGRALAKNIGLVSMKVLGGNLNNEFRLPKEDYEMAIRYTLSLKGLSTAVVGVNTMEHLDQLLETFRRVDALDEEEFISLAQRGLDLLKLDPSLREAHGLPLT